jgi:dGTPase
MATGHSGVRVALAPYAVCAAHSPGRRHPEAPPAWRDEFQRDRDRVIHCSAFRRLEYKTQVFVNHEGDMFRTRLTHSLEVAQIARTVARALAVNEDLTEAIALAHDLGHTPFGHAGQTALNTCMQPYGGFEHNLQSLRVVDMLEQRYPEFDGLNLMFETREGILKHCRPEMARELGDLGQRFLTGGWPSLEAQIANLADEIAYNHHDIDDGLRSGILAFDELCEHPVFQYALDASRAGARALAGKRLVYTAIRTMLGSFANDLIESSRARLAETGCSSADDIRALGAAAIDFSPAMRERHLSLKRLLHRELYHDSRVQTFTAAAADTVRELFGCFQAAPDLLPPERQCSNDASEAERMRAIADYIAGMTDRFAIAEHYRLLGTVRWPDAGLLA